MKIHIEFPDGKKFDFEKKKMDSERFYAVCGLIAAGMFFFLLYATIRS